MGYTAIWDSGPYRTQGYMGLRAMWDTQQFGPYGIQSNLGHRAIWDTQQFGPQGHIGHTAIWAIWDTQRFGPQGHVGLRAIWDTQQFGPYGIHSQLAPFSKCSIRYLGRLRGLHVVEPLPPNFRGGFSKIRGH